MFWTLCQRPNVKAVFLSTARKNWNRLLLRWKWKPTTAKQFHKNSSDKTLCKRKLRYYNFLLLKITYLLHSCEPDVRQKQIQLAKLYYIMEIVVILIKKGQNKSRFAFVHTFSMAVDCCSTFFFQYPFLYCLYSINKLYECTTFILFWNK